MTAKPIICRWLECAEEAHPDRYLCSKHLAIVYSAGGGGSQTLIRQLIVGLGVGVNGNVLYAAISYALQEMGRGGYGGGGGGLFTQRDRPPPPPPRPLAPREQALISARESIQAGDLDGGLEKLSNISEEDEKLMMNRIRARLGELRAREDRA